jgi:hypothetical protein
VFVADPFALVAVVAVVVATDEVVEAVLILVGASGCKVGMSSLVGVDTDGCSALTAVGVC